MNIDLVFDESLSGHLNSSVSKNELHKIFFCSTHLGLNQPLRLMHCLSNDPVADLFFSSSVSALPSLRYEQIEC